MSADEALHGAGLNQQAGMESRPRRATDPARLRAFAEPWYVIGVAALFGVYLGTAKLGIGLAVAHGVITPVWAPSGISLAVLVLFGRRYWPGVAFGAFAANATSGLSVLLAAGVSVGNTLAAVAGAYLLHRAAFRPAFGRVQDVLAFVVLGGLASTLISATNGTSLLYATDHVHAYGSNWLLWWFGDSAGNLLVAPLILVLVSYRRSRLTRSQALEVAALYAALAALGSIVFFAGAWRYPYLLFPFLIWAPLRFRQVGAATASFLVGALATLGAAHGDVPVGANATEGVQILQALISVVAISMLIVGATLAEREAANEALRQAQELTHIGSWEWDVRTDRITWSDELFRIYGLEPRSRRLAYGDFLAVVHPEDRAAVEAQVQRAYETHRPFSFEHRVVLPDGGERLLRARGRVELDESGSPVRMVGTGQDITRQRQIERLRDGILATVSHELRTPLTSVLGFALTLRERRGALTDEISAELVDHIAAESERLKGLLTDLLDIDRHRRGLIVPVRKPADLAPLVERVAERHSVDGHAVQVDAAPVTATVDASLVERIVDNLLGNALKHTPPGTPVALSLRADGDDVLIVVDDRGPGVPHQLRRSIFEIFDRGGKDPAGVPGMGVGLSIVTQFAAVHGGRAWVEDAPGGGASFRVLLPNCVQGS
jgi:PAS domain S-box-containing protein